MKPRYTNHNPRSFGFYTRHYSLLPLVGLVATSIAAVTFFSLYKFSKTGKRSRKKETKQEDYNNRDEYRQKTIETIEKTFANNTNLKNLYLEMEKAQYHEKMQNARSKMFEGI